MAENILVFPDSLLEGKNIKGYVGGRWMQWDLLSQLLLSSSFLDRDYAETRPEWKQIIPYCIVKDSLGRYLSYYRTKKSGETRLRGKSSIGIGGHVNDDDFDSTLSKEQCFLSGLHREIQEEIGVEKEKYSLELIGYLYDDTNDVGKVHFGVVFLVQLDDEVSLVFKDEALSEATFKTKKTLKNYDYEEYENWSKLIIDSFT